MKVASFDFVLPPDRIAQHPMTPRDAARMLVVDAGTVALKDRRVSDLPDFLRPGDLLVCNDTKVIPARLFGQRGAARVEILLHRRQSDSHWRVFARPARRLKPGDVVVFAPEFQAVVVERDGAEATLAFPLSGAAFSEALRRYGVTPLPPYIHRAAAAETLQDREDYQTLFARHDGAVAAPTAGLHFTTALCGALQARGVGMEFGTLHVGAGTFLPVRGEDVAEHAMHAEVGHLAAAAAARINQTRADGGRVVAVGTTSLRLLESAAIAEGVVAPFAGETALFITPGYRFQVVDILLTNFHLPRSTLFMLTCAFSGVARMQVAYRHAITTGYRFYSYGDCCLLYRS